MQISAAVMRSLAIVAIVALTICSAADAEKVGPCCVAASRAEVKEPIIDFKLQRKNLPGIRAIIFVTAKANYCIDPTQSWVLMKVAEITSQRKNRTSVEKDQVMEKIFTCIEKDQVEEKTLTCTEKAQVIEKNLTSIEDDQDKKKTFTCIQMNGAIQKNLTTIALDQDLEKNILTTEKDVFKDPNFTPLQPYSEAVSIEPESREFCTYTRAQGTEEG